MSKENLATVIDILNGLARIKQDQNWTYYDLAIHLDLPATLNTRRQLERWLHPERKGWVQPRAEVILKMQELVNESLK